MSFVAVAIGGASALSRYSQGQASKSSAYAQAASLEYQASQEKAAAQESARMVRRQGSYAGAAATAAYAGAGVQVGQGSAATTVEQIQQDSEHDAMTAILNGTKRGNALQTQGTFARVNGDLAASNANTRAIGTVMQAGYSGMQAGGWRTAGPGFSGTQAPAPVSTGTNLYPQG